MGCWRASAVKRSEHAVEFFNGEIVEEIEVEYVDKAFVVGIGFDGLTGECNFFLLLLFCYLTGKLKYI